LSTTICCLFALSFQGVYVDCGYIHDERNFDEYTQVLAGDTTNKMAFLGGE
jgi:hypothetical protein